MCYLSSVKNYFQRKSSIMWNAFLWRDASKWAKPQALGNQEVTNL